jgi:hypothetical protein
MKGMVKGPESGPPSVEPRPEKNERRLRPPLGAESPVWAGKAGVPSGRREGNSDLCAGDFGGLHQRDHFRPHCELQFLDRLRGDDGSDEVYGRLHVDVRNDWPFDDFFDPAAKLVSGIDALNSPRSNSERRSRA